MRAIYWVVGSIIVGAIGGAVCGAYGYGIGPILGATGAAWVWFAITLTKGAAR